MTKQQIAAQKPFKVKEAFYSLQGEGARFGRAAVFCRFSKCNLWNGKESGRSSATCQFCDTDILGTDGQNGGTFQSNACLIKHLNALWPTQEGALLGNPYIIFTGGEPALQLTESLVTDCQKAGFEVAIETNGTLPIPSNIDWVCVSPKGTSQLALSRANELKLVFPQENCSPAQFHKFQAEHFFLSPMASPQIDTEKDIIREAHTQQAMKYCLDNPKWRLTLQTHKLLGID